jgi:hypothetical protein
VLIQKAFTLDDLTGKEKLLNQNESDKMICCDTKEISIIWQKAWKEGTTAKSERVVLQLKFQK